MICIFFLCAFNHKTKSEDQKLGTRCDLENVRTPDAESHMEKGTVLFFTRQGVEVGSLDLKG